MSKKMETVPTSQPTTPNNWDNESFREKGDRQSRAQWIGGQLLDEGNSEKSK